MGTGWQLALVAVLVLANAGLAGTEIALLSLREGQLARLEQRGDNGRRLGRLARDPNRFLATIQVGITLAGFLASATAAVTLAEPLVEPLGVLGGFARPVAIVTVTAVLTFFTLVLGELAPKRIAMQRAERWALLAARPLSGLAAVARPVVWLLAKATDATVRLAGADPSRGREEVSAEEIRDLVASGGLYTRAERRVITGTLEATDRVLRQVLRPRTLVLFLAEDTPASSAIAQLVESGHTRAPVHRATIDDADRIVSLIDLVGDNGVVGDHARPALAVPETLPLIEALRQLQTERQSMALVVSEYGGLEGIVTVEDLVEEFVGEIHDEFDRDVRDAVRHSDGTLTVVGHFPVHDLTDLDVSLPEGDYVTVAGLIQERLGALPASGDEVTVAGWRLRVLAVRGRTIQQIRIEPERGDGATPQSVD